MPHEHSLSGKTVLVTGGCGFVASQLVRTLLARDVGEVRVLDNLRCGDVNNLAGYDVPVHELTLGDADPSELAPVLEGVDYLFHFAAETAAHRQLDDAGLLRGNVEGTRALYAQAARAGVKKIVFASSVAAYGRRSGPPLKETETDPPTSVYGQSKLAGEQLAAECGGAHGVEWNALRLFFVYGPRQVISSGGYSSVIVRTAKRVLAGDPPEIYGDGEQVFDYVYTEDVAAASIRALEAPVSGELFNVGTGAGIRIKDLIAKVSAVAGGESAAIHGAADGTAGTSRVADVSKIEQLLGWRANTTLDEGLRRTYAWLQKETDTSP